MTELLLLPYTLHFFASLFGGTLVYHGITVPLVLTSFEELRPPKYLEERRSPRSAFPLDYTTCDGCYFQIHKLQYLCSADVTYFKIFSTDI